MIKSKVICQITSTKQPHYNGFDILAMNDKQIKTKPING